MTINVDFSLTPSSLAYNNLFITLNDQTTGDSPVFTYCSGSPKLYPYSTDTQGQYSFSIGASESGNYVYLSSDYSQTWINQNIGKDRWYKGCITKPSRSYSDGPQIFICGLISGYVYNILPGSASPVWKDISPNPKIGGSTSRCLAVSNNVYPTLFYATQQSGVLIYSGETSQWYKSKGTSGFIGADVYDIDSDEQGRNLIISTSSGVFMSFDNGYNWTKQSTLLSGEHGVSISNSFYPENKPLAIFTPFGISSYPKIYNFDNNYTWTNFTEFGSGNWGKNILITKRTDNVFIGENYIIGYRGSLYVASIYNNKIHLINSYYLDTHGGSPYGCSTFCKSGIYILNSSLDSNNYHSQAIVHVKRWYCSNNFFNHGYYLYLPFLDGSGLGFQTLSGYLYPDPAYGNFKIALVIDGLGSFDENSGNFPYFKIKTASSAIKHTLNINNGIINNHIIESGVIYSSIINTHTVNISGGLIKNWTINPSGTIVNHNHNINISGGLVKSWGIT